MKFVVYKDARGEYRWRLVAANGRKIADSGEGYGNKADCLAAIQLVKEGAPEGAGRGHHRRSDRRPLVTRGSKGRSRDIARLLLFASGAQHLNAPLTANGTEKRDGLGGLVQHFLFKHPNQ
jgi:uncharacterized protein YegP (UPF0339 family)